MYNKKTITQTFILLSVALIWGFGFVAQRVGADHLPPFSFLMYRSILSSFTILPIIFFHDRRVKSHYGLDLRKYNRKELILAGVICGTALFSGSAFQQIGIAYTSSAKAGFISALYVILVPLMSCIFNRGMSKRLWFAVLLSIFGLYAMCLVKDASFGFGEIMMLLAATSFAIQILAINKFGSRVDGVRLSFTQSIVSIILAFIFSLRESYTIQDIASAAPALLYSGILSGGFAYTLQIIGQDGLDPTIASLSLCMESFFSAVGGFLLLNQVLKPNEIIGSALMMSALIVANIGNQKPADKDSAG